MLDMLIQGGRVVTPAGAGDWDVGIVGEKIVSVAFPGVLPAEAAKVIDARGKIVVPGGIETHAHAVANVQPGARTLVAGVPNAGPLEHSLGAIWGGTTTVIDFAPVPHAGDLAQGIHDYLAPWRGQAYTDYSTHCIYTTPPPASPPPPRLPTRSPGTTSSRRRAFPASRSSRPTSVLRRGGRRASLRSARSILGASKTSCGRSRGTGAWWRSTARTMSWSCTTTSWRSSGASGTGTTFISSIPSWSRSWRSSRWCDWHRGREPAPTSCTSRPAKASMPSRRRAAR